MRQLLAWEKLTSSVPRLAVEAETEYSPATILDTWSGAIAQTAPFVIPPTAKLVYRYTYPLGKTYRGRAEQCTFQVTIYLPEQLFPDTWMVNRINSAFENEIQKQGAKMLAVQVYQDITPTLTTEYYVVATATLAPSTMLALPVAWGVVIPVILGLVLVAAILGLFIWLIKEVKTIDWSKPAAAIGMALGIAAIIGAGTFFIVATRRKKEGGDKK